MRAALPGAVVPGPQGLTFSHDMQPPAAPQIVEQRRPDSPVGHLPPLVIAPFDPAAIIGSLSGESPSEAPKSSCPGAFASGARRRSRRADEFVHVPTKYGAARLF